jgi:uncharacterized membrane protein YfcA
MAFLQVMITLSAGLRIVFYKRFGILEDLSLINFLLLVAPLFLAIWLGHCVMGKIKPQHMRRGVFIFIGVTGIYYFLR